MQFPHNTDLYFFLLNKSTINIPLDDISDLMFEVSRVFELRSNRLNVTVIGVDNYLKE